MGLLKNRRELFLLTLASLSFLLLCFVELQLPLVSILKETAIGEFMVATATKNVASGLLIGLVSAYIFYVLIDYLPRYRKEQKTMEVLNSLIASILDAYNRCRIFGHETALPNVDKSVLDQNWLQENISQFKENKSKYLQLLFAMQTADSRLEDFRHSLPLAVILSPERAMQWLVLIDKVRLLAENYGSNPQIPKDKQHLVDKNVDENPVKEFKSTLNLRLLEFIEASSQWLSFK
jgi:hypothetical protein